MPRSTLLVLSFSLCFFAADHSRLSAIQDVVSAGQTKPKDAIEAGRKIISQLMEKEKIPGLSIAAQQDDQVVWAQGFGRADIENDVKVTTNTKFRLGSVSKILTASLAAKLAQEGKVDLDKDISAYLPDLPETHNGITLRHLLGHLGGIRHYSMKDFNLGAKGGVIDVRRYRSTKDALKLFVADPLKSKPGERYSYSTFGYTLVSAVLEKATGFPFPELLEKELFQPLQLNSTAVDDWRKVVAQRTRFYDRTSEGQIVNSFPVNAAYKIAGGGMLSTPSDLVKFGAAHFGPGFYKEETLQDIFAVQKKNDGNPTGVGLGWRIADDGDGSPLVHHAGNMAGCRAVLIVYPKQNLSVSVMTNLATRPPLKIERLAIQIAERFLAKRINE